MSERIPKHLRSQYRSTGKTVVEPKLKIDATKTTIIGALAGIGLSLTITVGTFLERHIDIAHGNNNSATSQTIENSITD